MNGHERGEPMATRWMAVAEWDLAGLGARWVAALSAAPAVYGVGAADLAALAAASAQFSAALETARTAHTRSVVSVAAKNTAKSALRRRLRLLAAGILARDTVPADALAALGLSPRKRRYGRIGPPATAPVLLAATNLGGGRYVVRLADSAAPQRRRKPEQVVSAEMFCCLTAPGVRPPDDLRDWTMKGQATTHRFDLDFSGAAKAAGRTAHLRARWTNPRGQPGPASTVLSFLIAA